MPCAAVTAVRAGSWDRVLCPVRLGGNPTPPFVLLDSWTIHLSWTVPPDAKPLISALLFLTFAASVCLCFCLSFRFCCCGPVLLAYTIIPTRSGLS